MICKAWGKPKKTTMHSIREIHNRTLTDRTDGRHQYVEKRSRSHMQKEKKNTQKRLSFSGCLDRRQYDMEDLFQCRFQFNGKIFLQTLLRFCGFYASGSDSQWWRQVEQRRLQKMQFAFVNAFIASERENRTSPRAIFLQGGNSCSNSISASWLSFNAPLQKRFCYLGSSLVL